MQEEWINFRPKLHSVPVIWYAAREMKSFAKAANLSTAWGLIKWKLPAHVQWLPDSEFHRDVSLLCLDLLVVKGWWQTTQHITWIPWMHVTRPLYAPVDNKQKPQIRVSQAVIILLYRWEMRFTVSFSWLLFFMLHFLGKMSWCPPFPLLCALLAASVLSKSPVLKAFFQGELRHPVCTPEKASGLKKDKL